MPPPAPRSRGAAHCGSRRSPHGGSRTTRWQQSPPSPGLPAPSPPSLAADPSLASPRNLAAIQDREICCYSISCKEKDNIGAWGGGGWGGRHGSLGASSRCWLPSLSLRLGRRGPQQGAAPSSGAHGLCDPGQVATWALMALPVTAGLRRPCASQCPDAPASCLGLSGWTARVLAAVWGHPGLGHAPGAFSRSPGGPALKALSLPLLPP